MADRGSPIISAFDPVVSSIGRDVMAELDDEALPLRLDHERFEPEAAGSETRVGTTEPDDGGPNAIPPPQPIAISARPTLAAFTIDDDDDDEDHTDHGVLASASGLSASSVVAPLTRLPRPPPVAMSPYLAASESSPPVAATPALHHVTSLDNCQEDSGSESAESDDEIHVVGRQKLPPFKPACPFPLLGGLTLVGCSFLAAALLLVFGVQSWGVREGVVATYNRAVDEWHRTHGDQMQRGAFEIVDLDQTNSGSEIFGGNLSAITNHASPSAPATSTVDSASSAAAASQNENGLNDQGDDVKPYSSLYYELLMSSPISWGSTETADVYWSNLLNHESRTLYFRSSFNGVANSQFNLTIPFIRRESKPHLTRHNCEAAMSGMYDRKSKMCSFFSQLHSICLRVKLVDVDLAGQQSPVKPKGGAGVGKILDAVGELVHHKRWSLDERAIGWELEHRTLGDPTDPPITSLVVPVVHTGDPTSNVTHTDATSVSGCIWDASLLAWTVGEYHAVDIRAEHLIERDGLGRGPAALQPRDDDDEETRALKHRLLMANLLRITVRHSSDPLLIATALTDNKLWFGLARTEKIMLAFVLIALAMVLLLAPGMSLVRYLSSRSRSHFSRSKRARKGGYSSVAPGGNSPRPGRSPSDDSLIELSSPGGNGRHRRSDSDDGPGLSPRGFVPSEALRRSLVSTTDSPARPMSRSPPTVSPEASPTRASPLATTRSARIRIDPVARYLEPRHEPASPTRRPLVAVLSRRPNDIAPQTLLSSPPTRRVAAVLRPRAPEPNLAQVLAGHFGLAELFSRATSTKTQMAPTAGSTLDNGASTAPALSAAVATTTERNAAAPTPLSPETPWNSPNPNE